MVGTNLYLVMRRQPDGGDAVMLTILAAGAALMLLAAALGIAALILDARKERQEAKRKAGGRTRS